MTMHEVHVSMFPDRTLTVGDAELTDLTRMGLIVGEPSEVKEDDGAAPEAAPQDTPPTVGEQGPETATYAAGQTVAPPAGKTKPAADPASTE